MYQVGILSKPSNRRFKIKSMVERQGVFYTQLFSSAFDLIDEHKMTPLSLIIINIEDLKPRHINLLKNLEMKLHGTPIVVVSSKISNRLRIQLIKEGIQNISLVDATYELYDLMPIVKKLIKGSYESQRASCRYPTDQRLWISDLDGQETLGRMINLSAGGAQLQVRNIHHEPGNYIDLDIPSDKTTGRNYHLRAQVVWTNPKEKTMGVRFEKSHLQLVANA